MIDVYEKQVRPVLEMAVPVWHPALTLEESTQIERVQRCALYIILGENYENYTNALEILELETLKERRFKLCEKFAKKALKHEKYKNWFQPNELSQKMNTRKSEKQKLNILKPVTTRTERYRKSPLPYLTEVLNGYYS